LIFVFAGHQLLDLKKEKEKRMRDRRVSKTTNESDDSKRRS